MCGIFCAVSTSTRIWPDDVLQERLKARGPDSCQRECFDLSNDRFLTFCSTVLSLRGTTIVGQPLQKNGLTLCWNGEAWSIRDKITGGNDTEAILDLLADVNGTSPNHALNRIDDLALRAKRAAELLSQVAGPYAFVLYDSECDALFYGRDFLGRRSLLKRTTPEGDLVLSSVGDSAFDAAWQEVSAEGVHCLDLASVLTSTPQVSPYVLMDECSPPTQYSAIPRLKLNETVPTSVSTLHETSRSVTDLHQLLLDSLSLRILSIPETSSRSNQSSSPPAQQSARLAVLFSGGLDCTVLARICHDLLPESEPIELLNVAFQNPRIHDKNFDSNDAPAEMFETCPDRITGRSSFDELCTVCPKRDWRFVAVNVPYTETKAHRQTVISLMHPHNTEMDLSISLALYFASRGSGVMFSSTNAQGLPYVASARVMLSGLGADELFGGYARHAVAYKRAGYQGLIAELNLDIGRLGTRNLGRDDRVLSNWGRETRFPFLDERLLAWAVAATVQDKCGFGEGSASDGTDQLEPEKKVLRCLAAKLGMKRVATEKKRAIQFGARTAKMETGKIKGTQLLEG